MIQSNYTQENELTDEQLAAGLQDCPEYLATIINRYQAPLSRYVFRLSGLNREDIEDTLQIIFLKLYLNINSFDQTLKFSTWLYRIAHNETINHYRKRLARPNIDYSAEDGLLNLLTDHNWRDEADRIVWKTQINQALNNLPDKYRQVIILRYFEDLDYQTIADIIKKPVGTVATLINRAKQKLKQLLTKKI